MTDFETWMADNDDRIYRYWVIKKMFTPAEQDAKWSDQSIYENEECEYGIISEAVELPDGDVLLGFLDPYTDEGSTAYGYITYYKLSEIHLAHSEND